MNAPLPPCRLSMRDIVELACAHFRVSMVEMQSARRNADLVWARSVTAYTIRELLPRSYPEIGRALGGRDHSTALYACRAVDARIRDDAASAKQVATFLDLCRSASPLYPQEANPFEVAARVLNAPTQATNVSCNTIRDLAAIAVAALQEATRQETEEERLSLELAATKLRLAALETPMRAFLNAFNASEEASIKASPAAIIELDKQSAGLAAAIETHFNIKRSFK